MATKKQQQPESILGRIRTEKEDFRTKSVRIAKGFLFNQYNTLQRIELYYNSRFETGEYDEDGFKKYFYNISRKPCDIASKEIDLDTKDILIRAENGNYLLADIMAREFKQWTKDEGFAKSLNEYADDAPKYGSVVVKKVPKTNSLHTVDLVNGFIITNQNARTLNHTNIIEPHIYNYDELRLQGWDEDKVEEAIKLYQSLEKPDVEVDERYGWVKESELEVSGSAKKMVYTLAIVAGAEEIEIAANTDKVIEKGVILYHEKIKTHPYREWHFARVKKRWLGLGFVETTFDPQMARNESKLYKRSGMRWTTLHLFQTNDETINKNLMLDAKNGEIIKYGRGSDPLSAVPVEERNLAEYQNEDNDWDKNVSDLTFSTEIVGGEKLPANTPATVAVITDANVKRFFDRKREDFALFVKGLVVDDIMPAFTKAKSGKHIFSLMGDPQDRDRFEQMLLDARLVSAFQQFVDQNEAVPSLEEWLRLSELEAKRLADRTSLDIEIPKDVYTDFKIKLDVVITKESEDTDAIIAGRSTVLNLLSSNPAVIANPLTRPIFLELAQAYGIKNLRLPNIPAPQAPLTPGAAMPGDSQQQQPQVAQQANPMQSI